MVDRSRSTGPVKKNIPLIAISLEVSNLNNYSPYATAGSPFAPPQPIRTIANVNVDITNLHHISTSQAREHCSIPKKAQGSRIGELANILGRMRNLWCKIQLLEQLRTQRYVGAGVSEARLLIDAIWVRGMIDTFCGCSTFRCHFG